MLAQKAPAVAIEEGPYVIFENVDDDTITVTPKWSQEDVEMQYSFNGTTWTDIPAPTYTPEFDDGKDVTPASYDDLTEIENTSGNKIYFRGKAPTDKRLFIELAFANAWVCADTTKITGNLNFLLCDDFGDETAPTTLADYCYNYMFFNCTSLTTAPSLPATTLAVSCYGFMFGRCTSLTTAPSLPATTLEISCYRKMFDGCSIFKVSATDTGDYIHAWRIPTEGTGTTASDWNKDMLSGTTGTFTDDPEIDTTYYIENEPV